MKGCLLILLCTIGVSFPCYAQQTNPADAPTTGQSGAGTGNSAYSPPTENERFKYYLHHTYGIGSILEAGARGGIDQARNRPKEWPQGGQGYADRFGSAMGMIAIRGTTSYLVGAAFKEDLRITRCHGCSLESKFKAAFDDTFTARKGEDGHRAFSVARLVGPVSGSIVAKNTWYPANSVRSETPEGLGITYGLIFGRNSIKELIAH